MADGRLSGEASVDAGDFASWLREMGAAIRGEGDMDVPCGGCTACCTAAQFVHIAPDEKGTLSRIPRGLLFPAPRMPRGHMVLGYDERGHCPMLKDGRCSIYEHRPQACRRYDCRVFPAAGLSPGGGPKTLITERAERWRFTFGGKGGAQAGAVRAAAAFLDQHRSELPDGAVPEDPTQLAVLAVALHDLFLGRDEHTGQPAVSDPGVSVVRSELARRRDTRTG